MKGLQVLATLLLLAAFCKAEDSSEEKKIKEIAKECADEQGLSKDDIEKIPRMMCAGEEMDRKLRCHTSCFYNKIGVIENGEVLTDEVKKTILSSVEEEKRKELEEKLEKCKNEVSGVSDECDKSVEFTKCLVMDTEFCKKEQ